MVVEHYKIIRFRKKGRSTIISTGLTLKEAKEHCSREDTHKLDKNGVPIWFDGYTKE